MLNCGPNLLRVSGNSKISLEKPSPFMDHMERFHKMPPLGSKIPNLGVSESYFHVSIHRENAGKTLGMEGP